MFCIRDKSRQNVYATNITLLKAWSSSTVQWKILDYTKREKKTSPKIIERSDRIMKNNQMFSQWVKRFLIFLWNYQSQRWRKKYNEQRNERKVTWKYWASSKISQSASSCFTICSQNSFYSAFGSSFASGQIEIIYSQILEEKMRNSCTK